MWRCSLLAILAAVVAMGCSDATRSPAASPASPAPQPAPRELLTSLAQWDSATAEARRAAADFVAGREPGFALLRMETFSCGGQTHEVAIYTHARTGMEFVLVPGGSFVMGAPPGTADVVGADDSHTRQHTVTLTRPFLISRTECTEAAWDRVGGSDHRKWHDPTLPIENVTWRECVAWCSKAGLEPPTEAQWEYACRAGSRTKWITGDDESDLASVAWYADDFEYPMQPVATKHPNAFGLYDVHGNVWEFCRDTKGPYPAEAERDPAYDAPDDPTYGSQPRAARGGIAYGAGPSGSAIVAAPSAWRAETGPDDHGDQQGFRPAKTVSLE